MSIWKSIKGKIILTGKEYDGKGFGIKALWSECNHEVPREDIPKLAKALHISEEEIIEDLHNYDSYSYILNNGKLTKFNDMLIDNYDELLNQLNIPTGSEGSFKVDILKSLIEDKISIELSGSIRGESMDKITEWLKEFIKDRKSEGWNFCKSTIVYKCFDGVKREYKFRIYPYGYYIDTIEDSYEDSKLYSFD